MPNRRAHTLVQTLATEINRLQASMRGALPDARMNCLADELFAATVNLVHAPGTDKTDLAIKLEILCRRLREFLDPEQRGEVLTALLAASIRDDLIVFRDSETAV